MSVLCINHLMKHDWPYTLDDYVLRFIVFSWSDIAH